MSNRGFFEGRWIRFTELDSPVRRVIFTTLAVFFGVAIAIAMRDHIGGPDLPTFALYHFPRNVFFVGVIMASVSIAMLLAGAVRLRSSWRYPLIAVILIAIGGMKYATPGFLYHLSFPIYETLTWLPLPFIALVLGLVWFGPRLTTAAAIYASGAIILTLVASVAAGTLAFSTVHSSSMAYATSAFTVVLIVASVAVAPAVMVVGFDFAEIGEETAAILARYVSKFRRGFVLISLVLCALAGRLAYQMVIDLKSDWITGRWYTLAAAALLITATLAIFAAMRHRPRVTSPTHDELGYLVVLFVAIFIFAAQMLAYDLTERTPGYLFYDGPRSFVIGQPSGMQETYRHLPRSISDPHAVQVEFYTKHSLPNLGIVGIALTAKGVPIAQPADISELIGPVLPKIKFNLGTPDANGWRFDRVVGGKKTQYVFYVLERRDSPDVGARASDWYVYCSAPLTQERDVEKICRHAISTFSISESAGLRGSRLATKMLSGLFLAGAIGLLMWAHIRANHRGKTGAIDFAALSLLVTALRWSGGYLFGGNDDPLGSMTISAELLVVLLTLFTLAMLAAMIGFGKQIQNVLFRGLTSTIILTALFYLYVYAVRGGESQTIRGIIVLLALSWELFTSGTNLNPAREHPAFPISSRILIFVGYLLLVATCVFLFSRQILATGVHLGAFDTELIVANALVILGGALILSQTLRQLAHLNPHNFAPKLA